MTMLDPEIELLIDTVPTRDLSVELLPEIRATLPVQFPELSDAVERSDHVVDEANGVVVRVHRSRGIEGAAPCVYSIHGGGYIRGTYEMDDAKFDRWCPTYGIVGVSVEYRLAPETSYPGPLEDCYAGVKWTYDNADEIGVDRGKIGITGVSAGGGLCAALALLARDRGEVPLQFQLLDCPMLDDRQITPSSQLDDLVIWTKQTNAFGWKCYLGDLYGSDDVPYTAAAARAEDLSGLPDAYVCVGGADGFRDEDITYAMRLYGAGVPTELHVYPGAPHGVGLFPQTQIAQRYAADREDWLRRQLERLG
ncbi:MAG: alpha/beta hydrolase [Acidimicrobiia bacterium]|nr:alpha/beta hydrolase [Acidimicrobiia bacterium]MYG59533.1 alpha/beta hydrolase [Acidimicrobiia bacterium]MYJ31617.1 alpha/beta hydrolase [Acidimicrobiia bacterium]